MLAERSKLEFVAKEKYDYMICDAIWRQIENYDYKSIHCYLPMGTEINITPLIQSILDKKIPVAVPKTLPKGNMENLLLSSLEDLEDGIFGTKHPAGAQVFPGNYDLIIVPGLAFDKANFRLGYGGGYYDKFLANNPNSVKLGICYPFQKMSNIPLEKHDVRLDDVLSLDNIF